MLKRFFWRARMKAIILAAGRGSRMCQLTEDQPKCLTQLAEKKVY
jgi:choline kinase